jgi:hypothetical protein
MNPVELAKKIEALLVDYDLNTSCTALEIVKLLLSHRSMATIDYDLAQLKERQAALDEKRAS